MTGWSCECGATGLGGVRCVHCGRFAWWYDPQPPRVPKRHLRELSEPPLPAAGLDDRGYALAVAIAVIVLAGLLRIDWVVRAEERRVERAFDAAVRELSPFVEQEHGAPFREPVSAELLDDDDFLRLFGGGGAEAGDPAPTGFTATMYALGLADPDDDVDALAGAGFDSSIVGVYDEESRTLYVRGDEVTPYARLVIVHELTHAWQDQHYGLAALREKVDDSDGAQAVDALVEGDATRVEQAWRARQSAADRAEIEREDSSAGDEREPARAERSLGLLASFPYSIGVRFVRELHERGGNAAIDRAFADPPASTEQILHPERYLRKHAPKTIFTPGGDGTVLDEGVLGELGVLLAVGRGEVDERTFAAADGWGGDAYVTWDDDQHLCTMAVVASDSRAQRSELVAALRARERPPGVFVRADGLVEATFCVPSRG